MNGGDAKLENVLEIVMEHFSETEDRIAALEQRIVDLESDITRLRVECFG